MFLINNVEKQKVDCIDILECVVDFNEEFYNLKDSMMLKEHEYLLLKESYLEEGLKDVALKIWDKIIQFISMLREKISAAIDYVWSKITKMMLWIQQKFNNAKEILVPKSKIHIQIEKDCRDIVNSITKYGMYLGSLAIVAKILEAITTYLSSGQTISLTDSAKYVAAKAKKGAIIGGVVGLASFAIYSIPKYVSMINVFDMLKYQLKEALDYLKNKVEELKSSGSDKDATMFQKLVAKVGELYSKFILFLQEILKHSGKIVAVGAVAGLGANYLYNKGKESGQSSVKADNIFYNKNKDKNIEDAVFSEM